MVGLQKRLVRPLISAGFTLLVVVFVWKNWSTFGQSVQVLQRIALKDFWLSAPLVVLTFVLAAFAYNFLAFHQLKLRELLLVELAAAFINRLIPSGLGGLGVHGVYLHKRKHTVAEATAVVSVNNLVGMSVHLLLLALVLLTGSAGQFHLVWSPKQGWILLGVVFLLAAILSISQVRLAVRSFMHNLLVSLRRYERQPHKLVYAALALAALTLINLFILHLAARSFGVWLDLPQLFLVYTGGVLLGAAVPTPGGLAGVEAGLAGGFMAYGVGNTTAIAIALAFRLATYWLPLIPGFIGLVLSRNREFL